MTQADNGVVITGLGAVSPNGLGVRAYTQALRAGRSGLKPLPFEHEHVKTPAVGAADDFEPTTVVSASDVKRLPRLVPMAMAAAQEALGVAQIDGLMTQPDGDADAVDLPTSRRVGLILGTGGGGIDFTVAQFDHAQQKGHPSLWTITNATHGNLAGELSIRLGLRGPSHCVSTGCTSSSDALGTAMLHLQAGRCDAMVVGGADSHLVPGPLWGMQLLGCMTVGDWSPAARASRPFDADRDGFVIGEGAWFVVLERADFAKGRGADVIARLAGYGSTCDAYHRVRPAPDPDEAVTAIHLALEQAQLPPEAVGYVHYHGTSTQLNDTVETRAIRAAFGDHANKLPGSSVKSMIGHPQGACGAAAVVATIASLKGMDGGGGFLPPTINLDTPDPACDLDYVANTSRSASVEHALVNCLAFGAKNSALVLSMA